MSAQNLREREKKIEAAMNSVSIFREKVLTLIGGNDGTRDFKLLLAFLINILSDLTFIHRNDFFSLVVGLYELTVF